MTSTTFFDDDMDWLQFRANALEFERNQLKTIIEPWAKECGVNSPIGYYRSIQMHTLTLYTDKPGHLIGCGGKNIHKLEQLLLDEFKSPYKVELIEIRGGYVNV